MKFFLDTADLYGTYPHIRLALKEAPDYARMGLVPGGAYRNREYVGDGLDTGDVEEVWIDLLCDPQTSGGLLMAVPESEADSMLRELARAEIGTEVSFVGEGLESGCEKGRMVLEMGEGDR